ncbi:MAG TPA: FAD-dependent oxidoreductase [Myxococcaceae bacterium]|jgi:D-amino-acid oxidase
MPGELSGTTATVIGAGVSGLTCALRLAEAGARVRVLAADPPPRTVSSVAAAVWYPYRAYPEALVLGWSRRSREVFDELASVPDSGVARREGLELFRATQPDPWWRSAVRSFRHAAPDELPTGAAGGWAFEAPVIDMGRYLPFLVRRLARHGVRLDLGALQGLDPAGDGDLGELVVNCSGLGARELAPDPSLRPIRGQVVRVANPGLKRFLIDDHHPGGMAYVIPRSDDVILGGTAEEGATSMDPDPATTAAILQRCADLEPAVASARVLEVKVGLRPGRPSIRLEVERRGPRAIVHNYGHGGAGVTTSWGCAEAVVGLCTQAIQTPP